MKILIKISNILAKFLKILVKFQEDFGQISLRFRSNFSKILVKFLEDLSSISQIFSSNFSENLVESSTKIKDRRSKYLRFWSLSQNVWSKSQNCCHNLEHFGLYLQDFVKISLTKIFETSAEDIPC